MFHLSSAKHHGKFNFVAFANEFAHLVDLDVEVMRANLRPHAQFFDLAALVFLAGFFEALFAFIAKL